jgi:hypothetical protein
MFSWKETKMSITTEDLPRLLANAAMGRAVLLNGMVTARSCGDGEWAFNNRNAVEEYETEIEQLKTRMTKEEIREARLITNAPI